MLKTFKINKFFQQSLFGPFFAKFAHFLENSKGRKRTKKEPFEALLKLGGSGIRTHGTLACSTVFKTAPINHSGIPPKVTLNNIKNKILSKELLVIYLLEGVFSAFTTLSVISMPPKNITVFSTTVSILLDIATCFMAFFIAASISASFFSFNFK